MKALTSLEYPRDTTAPKIVVISGGMGVGKGSIIKRLHPWMNEALFPETGIIFSKSWTTRKPRPNEDPESYCFVTEQEFENAVKQGLFTEWTQHSGNYYGTPKVDDNPRLLEIEVNGARELHAQYGPEKLAMLYVAIDTPDELLRRLMNRPDGMDQKTKLMRFARVIREEMPSVRMLPYHIIMNRNLDLAVLQAKLALSGCFTDCLPNKKKFVLDFIDRGEEILKEQ